jgi:hypothetical protein
MTAPYGDSDLAFVLKDCGVPVSTTHVPSAFGIFDKADTLVVQDGNRGEVVSTVPSVTVQASAYSAADLEIDQPITVDGVNYVIRDHSADSDGALKKLFLRRA